MAGPFWIGVITIVIRNFAGLSQAEIDTAATTTAAIYRDIGIRVIWEQSNQFPVDPNRTVDICQAPLVIDLVPGTAAQQAMMGPNSLGDAALNDGYARVFMPRIDGLTQGRKPSLRAEVLGHVIAHEVGHLLLGRRSHAAAGLMAPTLDVRLAAQHALGFHREEIARIHRNVTCGVRALN